MHQSMARILSLALLGLTVAVPLRADDSVPHVYSAGRIWTAVGEPIQNGLMVVRNGRIQAVGPAADVEVPDGAVRHDLSDSVIIPGLVIAETSLGNTRDDNQALTPQVRAIDGFDFYQDYSKEVAGGVTTVQISPGTARLMPGRGAVVKLAGESPAERILADTESLRILLTQTARNPPRIYEPPVGAVSVDNPLKPTRPQVSASLAGAVAGLRAVLTAAREGDDDPVLEAVAEHLKENGPVRVSASQAAEIRAALKLAAEYELPLILVNPVSLDPFLDGLKAQGIVLNVGLRPGRITNPGLPDPEVPQPSKPWEYAAQLSERGLGDKLAIRPSSDADLADMMFVGGLFTRSGNGVAQALQMLTVNPARILGVEDRVGSLQAGRDADFVVLSGEPFASGSHVRATYVNGRAEFDVDAERATVIRAAAVYTGDGTVVRDASVVVGGQKVRGLGTDVSAAPDARIRNFKDAVIVPGYIDLATGLGLGGPMSGGVSTSTKLGERLVSNDKNVDFARRGGITTAVLSTSGSPSPLMAFKLGRTARVLKDPVGIRFSVSSNLTSGVPALERTLLQAKAYADTWTRYEAALAEYNVKMKAYAVEKAKYDAAKAKKAAEEKAKAEASAKADAAKAGEAKSQPAEKPDTEKSESQTPKPGEKPKESEAKSQTDAEKKPAADDKKSAGDEKKATATTSEKKEAEDPNAPKPPTAPKKPSTSTTLEPYRALFAGRIPAVVDAGSVNTIKAAVKIFREKYKLKTILVGGADAYRVPELLADNDISIALGPTLVRDVDSRTINLPQVMSNHQVPFAFQSKATTGAAQLPLAVQYAVHKGLGRTDALRGLTHRPAELLTLDSHIGTLAPGKDADLVVLSGPPFDVSSEVLAVMIDGVWVYEKEDAQ